MEKNNQNRYGQIYNRDMAYPCSKAERRLQDKKLFLFDIDGTLAVGKTLVDGTKELLSYIEAAGGQSFYITNNSSKSREDYVKQFADWWGIAAKPKQFVTASYAAVLYLQEHYAGKKLFVLGTSSFVKELERAGLCVTEVYDDEVVCVVAGFDQELRYRKLYDACRLLSDPAVDFAATNPDLRCPASFGFIPDCGSICTMLTQTTGREPYYIGKPNRRMVDLCVQQAEGTMEEVLVVGDRLYTDIACGIEAGAETAVVFTGEAKPEDMTETVYPASYTFPSVRELLKALQTGKDGYDGKGVRV